MFKVQFRNKSHDSVNHVSNIHSIYTQDSYGDSWFRCDFGIAKGYGLMIQKVIINQSGTGWQKGKMWYNNQENELNTALVWVFIPEDSTAEKLYQYIRENKSSWIP